MGGRSTFPPEEGPREPGYYAFFVSDPTVSRVEVFSLDVSAG